MRRLLAFAAAIFVTIPLCAQSPAAEWRTVTTEHFRIHYPEPYAQWALRAASRMESIREAVIAEIGYAPPRVIDVIVSNPTAEPNGLAYPILDAPRILLFTDPPQPTDEIGEFREWAEIVSVHEYAHQAHLLRPSRNPFQHVIERLLLPVGPIGLAAPRWVSEGYATVVEGRLSLGRPTGSMRAAVMRKWAAEGRMPSYKELSSDRRFMGMSMAYLAGSTYLEWLEDRSGPGSLRKLWSRMTARRRRNFDAAFEGVFGEKPDRLYGRFVAELTEDSVRALRETPPQEGELWQETRRGSGSPAVSPDGKRIAVVLAPELRERRRNRSAQLVVWSTDPPSEEEEEFQKRIDRMLERDPEDVPPVRTKPLPREPIHTLTMPDGGDIETPRWTRDGKSIVFVHRQPDLDGFLHPDLFRWIPGTGHLDRLTHLADVSGADVSADGTFAVAVRDRHGASQLVRVDLDSGAVEAMTAPAVDRVYSHPRLNASGSRLAYIVHREGLWRLVLRDLRTGSDREVDLGSTTSAAEPEWSRVNPDEIYFVAIAGGRMDVHILDASGAHRPITRASGAAISPASSPDGRLFFMGLETEGYVVRVLSGAPATPPAFPDPEPLPSRPAFAERPLSPPRDYFLGRQEWSVITGENFAPGGTAIEAGIRLGDVIGRLDTLAVASFGRRDAPQGAAVASAWRGWPIGISAHLFQAEEGALDLKGGELRAFRRLHFPRHRLDWSGGVLLANESRRFAFGEVTGRTRVVKPSARIDGRITLGAEAGSEWRHSRGEARIAARVAGFSFALSHERRSTGEEARISLGGLASTIIPQSAYSGRVLDPALPPGVLGGEGYDGSRAELFLGSATLFYQRHALERSISLAGLSFETSSDPLPIVNFPGFRLTAGVARILSEPLRGRTRWWFGVRFAP